MHNRLGAPPNYLYYQQVEALEQLVRNQQVGGSIPLAGSTDSPQACTILIDLPAEGIYP